EAIVAYREANGPFAVTADLANVKGIGERTIEKNAARLAVK
ncbi:competence protein ComEA, partial [Marinobacter sp. Z-F4-2]